MQFCRDNASTLRNVRVLLDVERICPGVMDLWFKQQNEQKDSDIQVQADAAMSDAIALVRGQKTRHRGTVVHKGLAEMLCHRILHTVYVLKLIYIYVMSWLSHLSMTMCLSR